MSNYDEKGKGVGKSHGKLFDSFPMQGGETQHGARFDERFGGTHTNRHGRLADESYRHQSAGAGKHGEHWDVFEWTDMPSLHSDRFDTDFKVPTAGRGDHGTTWYDVFRGGRTHVKYLYGGADYEGTVIHLSTDEATVENRRGERHSIGLPQILAYHTAQGNPHNDEMRTAEQVDIAAERGLSNPPQGNTGPSNRTSASGGRLNENRTSVDVASITEQIFANKTVAKGRTHIGTSHHYSDATGREFHVGADSTVQAHRLAAQQGKLPLRYHGFRYSKALGGALSKGHAPEAVTIEHPHLQDVRKHVEAAQAAMGKTGADGDLAKAVDSTETSTQGQDVEGGKSNAWCPHCKHYCKHPTADGLCPTCGGRVEAKKSDIASSLDVLKVHLHA